LIGNQSGKALASLSSTFCSGADKIAHRNIQPLGCRADQQSEKIARRRLCGQSGSTVRAHGLAANDKE
jgi:hypothetical protein